MKINNNYMWLAKSIGYSLTVNILTCVIMVLYAQLVISDIVSLIILLVTYIVLAILYGIIKGEVQKPFLYNIVAIISHIISGNVIIFVLGLIYKGWENAMFVWTGMFTTIFIFITVLLETIIHLINKRNK